MNDNGTNVFATSYDNYEVYGAIALLTIAIVICIVLSFTQVRVKKSTSCINGRPGIVYPINFLNPRHRLVYVLACGALASEWFLFFQVPELVDNKWLSDILHLLVVFLIVLLLVILTYPILACVEAPIPLVGYILGSIYCDVFFFWRVFLLANQLSSINTKVMSQSLQNVIYGYAIVANVPQTLCLFGIVVWYHYKLIKELHRICKSGSHWKKSVLVQPKSKDNVNYVKELLKCNRGELTFFKKNIYTGVRLPLPVMIIAIVVFTVIFQLMVTVSILTPYYLTTFAQALNTFINTVNITSSFIIEMPNFLQTISAISVISPVTSTVVSCLMFFHYLYSLKKNMQDLIISKGDFFNNIKWPALTLSSATRYAGYQVAAVVIAWIMYTAVTFVVFVAVAILIYFPSFLGYYYYKLFVYCAGFLVFIVIQIVVCKIIFVTCDSSSLRTVILNNRRAYQLFSYVMFLYNIGTGLMAAIWRVAGSFFFMLLTMPRMDRILFLKGFEKFDLGYNMFTNFMLMETLLHNPIVHVFIEILLNKKSNKGSFLSERPFSIQSYGICNQETCYTSVRPRCSFKARNRWFVAYTLIKNPQLRTY